ncbi:AP-4 complex subunit epsilon-1 [Actinomortierella ambigua]|uniref:AP-4 complex subunit epsilon-1 n=1 Tax=Actinomortierella ambigua TaxID=1343610 RepID=A0A9P6QB99_9FUNG|nr:AP-4 complex subunit epsilon-1 [Actinomortierella ambigua]
MDSLSREVVKIFSSLSSQQQQQQQQQPLQGKRTTQDDAFSRESVARLKQTISNPNTSTATMKDNMVKLIYGEMMGYPVQFGAIYALKLAQSGQTVAEKRAGYVACSLLLLDGNELNIMLVNTLQKDLSSSNYHHVIVALITLCSMTLTDVIPALVTPVLQVFSHPQETVRKRAVIALKRFYIQLPEMVLPYLNQLKDALRDPEPSVMSAALGLFAEIVKDHAEDNKDLVPILIRILKQVVEGRLPKGYMYHGMPAPWIQVRCLHLMALLGFNDLSASKAMTPVVMAAFHRAAQGVDAAFAVLFEVIKTLNTFHPDIILELVQSTDPHTNPLLVISRFATSANPNLRYLGMALLDQVLPQAWCDTWWTDSLLTAVVESLDSRDASLQRRTLDLLFRLLTRENSLNIIERLTVALHSTEDPLQRDKLLGQILRGSEAFGQSEEWYVDSVFALLASQNPAVTLHAAELVINVLERGKIKW